MREDQIEEVLAIKAIFGGVAFDQETFQGTVKIAVSCHDQEIQILLCESGPEAATGEDSMPAGAAANPQPAADANREPAAAATVHHLPPLTLEFSFPRDYPEAAVPDHKLSAAWLSQESLDQLSKRLDDITSNMPGEVVLYSWVQFLQDSSLATLGLQDQLIVPDEPARKLLLDHNLQEQKQEFDCCMICFMEIRGTDFEVLTDCGHAFCRKCLKGHCLARLEDGELSAVRCPDPSCKAAVDGAIIKSLIPPKKFEQYDQNLLNFTLRSMSSTVWCPRLACQYPAQSKQELKLGECPQCALAFCLKCQRAYHGTSLCKEDEPKIAKNEKSIAQIIQEQKNKDLREIEHVMATKGSHNAILKAAQIVNHTFTGISRKDKRDLACCRTNPTKRQKLEKNYGKPYLTYYLSGMYDRQAFYRFLGELSREDAANQKAIKDSTSKADSYDLMADVALNDTIRLCPLCYAPIEKNGGCHHMHCRMCNGHFCWNCLQSMLMCSETKCQGRNG